MFVSVKHVDSIAVISMSREPVNSMNSVFWQELLSALDSCESSTSTRAIIFISGLSRPVFTAGNDITEELFAPNTSKERFYSFWTTSNEFLRRLYQSRLLTICAIRGSCPAGGCVLAMCCDYRLMTNFGEIGLNEVQLGIAVPKYWAELMIRWIGRRNTERMTLEGKLVRAKEALEIGLVDQIVERAEDLLEQSESLARRILKTPESGRTVTKSLLRAEFSQQWQIYTQQEKVLVWNILSAPQTIPSLQKSLSKLSKSKL
jgi:3,2-trans-enoyl-CoA isomerase